MSRPVLSLWLLWGAMFATVLVWLVLPWVGPHRAEPWYEAQTAVIRFAFAILGLVAAVASFAVRESLVLREVREGRLDPETEGGIARLRLRFLALWALCAAIGVLGGLVAYFADRAATGWPYLAGAAVLFVVHAPRERFLQRVREGDAAS
jgi:hypothetical protein